MLVLSQVTPTSSSAPLTTVPPGPCELVISNVSGVTVYIGTGTVTTSNGFPIPTGAPPVAISTYPGSKGQALTVIAGSGSVTGTVGVLISTTQ